MSDALLTFAVGLPANTNDRVRVKMSETPQPEPEPQEPRPSAAQSENSATVYPELVICLCAAVGTDTKVVTEALCAELQTVGYTPVPVRLSALMSQLPGLEFLASIKEEDVRIRQAMQAGNAIRRKLKENDAVVRLALAEIQAKRAELKAERERVDMSGGTLRTEHNDIKDDVPADRHCFIISSLKRREEIVTIRTLFGDRAILVSIYEPREQRLRNLCKRIAKSRCSPDPDQFQEVASELIKIDQKERDDTYGQQLERVFPLADIFLRADSTLRENVRRFIQLLFKAPFVTPNLDEFLMFHAKAASQRTADLSRQVGAVIATTSGEILATGCNEVPRAGGGVNWDNVAGTDKDYRDYKIGQDPAAAAKSQIAEGVLGALKEASWLASPYCEKSREELALEALYSEQKPLAGTMIADIIEFGRIVHAEMAAVCDAAMRGVSIRDATLYCTTFPCHMCARLLLAAGIKRVVFIEPYPKSQTKKLYRRAVQVDEDSGADPDALKFEAFVGVAPNRFLQLFEFVERKDDRGYALGEVAPSGAPKGITVGSLVSELESDYLGAIKRMGKVEMGVEGGENGR